MEIIVHMCLPTTLNGDSRRACMVLSCGPTGLWLKKASFTGQTHHLCDHECRAVYSKLGDVIAEVHNSAEARDAAYMLVGHDPLTGEIPVSRVAK